MPRRTWVHWVVCKLPADCTGLAEGDGGDDLPAGTIEGTNDWQRVGYGGPCPPVGEHRYFHKLSALDVVLPAALGRATKAALEQAMRGHVLGQADLVGLYRKRG